MDTEKFRANVQANLLEGERRQVNQTPTFIIGDKLYPGAMPFDEFKKIVESASKTPAPAASDTSAKKTK
jgi:protein-disulfide isomerase